MDPNMPLAHSRVRAIIFANAHDPNAWVFHQGAQMAEYTDPVSTIDGSVLEGSRRKTDTFETIQISLSPLDPYLQHLAAQGLLVLHQPPDVHQPDAAPASPVEEDP